MVTASRIDLDWIEDRMYIDEGTLSEDITNVSAQTSNWDGFQEIDAEELPMICWSSAEPVSVYLYVQNRKLGHCSKIAGFFWSIFS